MGRGRLAITGALLGAVASQAGHLVAYQLRYGPSAGRLQSMGAHAYFPTVLKTGVGLVAAFLVLSLMAIGLARLLAGRRLDRTPAPPMLRLVAILFCIQLTCFFVQETIEVAMGAPATSASSLLLWGTAGQLPVALVAAFALRWLAVRLAPSVAQLLAPATTALRPAPPVLTLVAWPAPVAIRVAEERLRNSFTRRGPPS